MSKRVPLTGLRAVAWFWVLGFHVMLLYQAYHGFNGTGRSPLGEVDGWIWSVGFLGVDLFFALSAFVIARSLTLNPDRGSAGFYLRRVARILPAYVAAVLLFAIAFTLVPHPLFPVSGLDIARHLLFLHTFTPESFYGGNPVLWSLAIEMQFYLLAPALLWLIRRIGPATSLVLALGVQTAYLVAVSQLAVSGPFYLMASHQLPGFLGIFVLGSIAGMQDPKQVRLPWRTRSVHLVGLLLLAMVAVWLTAGRTAGLAGGQTLAYTVFGRPIAGLALAGIVIGVAFATNRITQALASRPMVAIGEWSYGLYLLHYGAATLLLFVVTPILNAPVLVGVLVLGALIAPMGWAWYRFVERPGQAVLLRLQPVVSNLHWPAWSTAAKRTAAFTAIVAVVATILRIPFTSKYLATWDSVLFALGINRYDVIDARPHPPGYPTYVALGKLFHSPYWTENTTLVALSLAFFVLSCGALAWFAYQRSGPAVAMGAVTLWAVHPIVLYDSLIATTYVGEGLATALLGAIAFWYWRTPTTWRLTVLAVAFAFFVGFRQSIFLFLAPLIVYAAIAAPGSLWYRIRRCLVAGTASFVAAMAWFLPMVAHSQGLAMYREATSLQTRLVVFHFTVWEYGNAAWQDLWPRFQLYIETEAAFLYPMALGATGALAIGAAWNARTAGGIQTSWNRILEHGIWLVWLAPPLVFYLTIFNGWGSGPSGYILVVLPQLLVLSLMAIHGLTKRLPRQYGIPVFVLLVVASALPMVQTWNEVDEELSSHDDWSAMWLGLNTDPDFAPAHTAIMASYSWAHVKWHHPDHVLFSMLNIPDDDGPWHLTMTTQHREEDRSFYDAHLAGPDDDPVAIPDPIERLVLFDFQIAGENGGPRLLADEVPVQEAFLENGWRVLWVDVSSYETISELMRNPVNTRLEASE